MKHRIHLPDSAFDGGSPQHVRVPSGSRFTFHRGEAPELALTEDQVRELDAAGYICEPIRAAVPKPATTPRRSKSRTKKAQPPSFGFEGTEATATEED